MSLFCFHFQGFRRAKRTENVSYEASYLLLQSGHLGLRGMRVLDPLSSHLDTLRMYLLLSSLFWETNPAMSKISI